MSMSLDGFIAGPNDGPGNGLGTGGDRLHEWLGEPVSKLPHFDPPGLSGQVFAEVMATGAVVVGRKTFDYADHWGGDHLGVPIFVPTRGTPPEPQSGWVHYVPDPATAMREAKAAAGDQDVMVHGAGYSAQTASRSRQRACSTRPASRTFATGWCYERPLGRGSLDVEP
jgi:dihydrofolate reductase